MDVYMMKKVETIKKLTMRKVFRECAGAMCLPLLFITIYAILSNTLSIVIANTLGEFADAAFELNFALGIKDVWILVVCIIAVAVIGPGIELLGNFIMLKKTLQHDNIVFGHYLDKEPEKAMAMNAGEVQYQLEDAPMMMRIYWVRIFTQVFALPICFGYLLYCAGGINWLLTGVMLLLTLIRLVIPVLFKTKLGEYDKLEQAYRAKRRAYESDVITKPYFNKLLKIQKPVQERINQLFTQYYKKTESKAVTYRVCCEQLQELVNKITMILLLLLGAVMIAKRYVTPGEFTAMFVYFSVAETLFQNLGEAIQNYPLLKNAADRVCEFYQDEENVSGCPMEHFQGLKGEKVNFAFEDKNVLHNLNFCISMGDKVGIWGKNGAGKSTLSKLICMLFKSYEGVITTENLNLKTINAEDWRKLVAYAPQASYIFYGTVRENIMIANPEISKEVVDKLMGDFGILPLADRVISMDSELSGGERQKISIIRALVKKAELLILDEPSNHLDEMSVFALKKYIETTKKTVIIISHDDFLLEAVTKYVYI